MKRQLDFFIDYELQELRIKWLEAIMERMCCLEEEPYLQAREKEMKIFDDLCYYVKHSNKEPFDGLRNILNV